MDGDSTSGLVELERDECLRLLAGATVGRIATGVPGWPPLIRPVIYAFDAPTRSIVFRSAEGSKLTSLMRSERVAFEIDGTDPGQAGGWSVIVIGAVEEVTGEAELARLAQAPPDRGLSHCMRIRATVVSGRRLTIA